MKSVKKAISSLLASTLLLSGCSTDKKDETNEEPANHIDDVENNPDQNIQDNRKNSILLTDLIYNDEKDNILFSPLSLNYCLGLIVEGANGNTKDEIEAYLGTESFSEFALDYMNQISNYNANETMDQYALELANGIFIDKDFSVKDDYISRIQNYYQSSSNTLDFSDSDNSAKYINDWCNEKTHEMIPEIVSPADISKNLAIVLANSLYFRSPWLNVWNESEEMEDFNLLDGSNQSIHYLYNSGDLYFENDYATAFASRYQSGLYFIGILPKKEGEFNLTDLDIPGLLENQIEVNQINCKMPSLNYENSISLNDYLSALGIVDAFGNADFSNLTDESVVISKILQKTKIELDEKGTKAAAVSVAMMVKSAFIENPIIKEVYLDRPYAYLIYDYTNNQILFIGKVVNP